jgi:hypothetical protein
MSPNLADAAALIETILETVVHRAVEQHPVSIGRQNFQSGDPNQAVDSARHG